MFNNSFAAVNEEVDIWVKYTRMKVCRQNDLKMPTIPAPFQAIIYIFKQCWFFLIEPVVFVATGKIINEERLICTFEHMKYFFKEDFYDKKQHAPRLRLPFFVEFNDHVEWTSNNYLIPTNMEMNRVIDDMNRFTAHRQSRHVDVVNDCFGCER